MTLQVGGGDFSERGSPFHSSLLIKVCDSGLSVFAVKQRDFGDSESLESAQSACEKERDVLVGS